MHFAGVRTVDLKDVEPRHCDNFDVTILDYDGDGFKAPRPELPKDFDRPVITVAVAGGLMSSNWDLKTGYL